MLVPPLESEGLGAAAAVPVPLVFPVLCRSPLQHRGQLEPGLLLPCCLRDRCVDPLKVLYVCFSCPSPLNTEFCHVRLRFCSRSPSRCQLMLWRVRCLFLRSAAWVVVKKQAAAAEILAARGKAAPRGACQNSALSGRAGAPRPVNCAGPSLPVVTLC